MAKISINYETAKALSEFLPPPMGGKKQATSPLHQRCRGLVVRLCALYGLMYFLPFWIKMPCAGWAMRCPQRL